MLDVIALNRYLAGLYYVSDPSVMDVDGNFIVNKADSFCAMTHVAGLVYEWSFVDVMETTESTEE